MARAKNIYIEDLGIVKNGKRNFLYCSHKGVGRETLDFKIAVRNLDGQDCYEIFGVYCSWNDELKELIESRYLHNVYSKETMNIRLRDTQYEVRKAVKAYYENHKVELENTVDVEINNKAVAPVFGEVMKAKIEEAIEEIIIDDKIEDELPVLEPIEKPEPVMQRPEVPRVGLEAQIYNLVFDAVESKESKDAIRKTIKAQLDAWGIVPNKTELHIKVNDKPAVNVGTQHKDFPTILTMMKAKANVALVGPAGSGKTTCVEQAAKVLDLPFYAKSVTAQTGSHEFFGYQDANGKYVKTLFREAYENGGVFLIDEYDNGNPNVLAGMNAATANNYCAFADGMVEKHADFICVAAGNTYGHGATSQYVGRNKIDDATLDRFVFWHFEYDEKFEMQLAANKDWCKIVQKLRKTAAEKKIKTIISPRATFYGSQLLAAGLERETVLQACIYKGLTGDEVEMIKAGLPERVQF